MLQWSGIFPLVLIPPLQVCSTPVQLSPQVLDHIVVSKEVASWISRLLVSMEFAERFSVESCIRQRTYNLIVLRVLMTFKLSNVNHLHKLEEVNNLSKVISNAKWIKPLSRRRADQMNAYTILSLFSVESANLLIRDGLLTCGTKVWPKKQKIEPI